MKITPTDTAPIPLAWVGPIHLVGPHLEATLQVPLATFETPLWPSVNRGARVTAQSGGIRTELIHDTMTRSILLEGNNAASVTRVAHALADHTEDLRALVASTSSFAQFQSLTSHVVGNLLYLRLAISSGDASGHNMVTKAADALMGWILERYPQLSYGSLSGNVCTDKKVSAANVSFSLIVCISVCLCLSLHLCFCLIVCLPECCISPECVCVSQCVFLSL